MTSKTVYCLLAVFLVAVVLAHAQSAERDENYTLDTGEQHVIRCLYGTHAVDLKDWQYHDGDISHGESTDLDTHAWPLGEDKVTSTNSALWIRRVIEIPATLNGYSTEHARLSFAVTAWADQYLTRIVYINGERVAMGEELTEPVVLTSSAKAGTRFVVAEKFLGGSGKITFSHAELLLQSSPGRPDPMRLHDELRSAAQLVKSGSPQAETLKRAFAKVNTTALIAGETAKFDSSLEAAEAELRDIQPWLHRFQIDLTGNSHIDAAWLWPRSETIDVVHRTFGTALQLMNEYPTYTFTQSAPLYAEWIDEKYPMLSADIHRRVKEGRWEWVGGMWVEPDLNMPDGESLVRQLLVGKGYLQREYGVDVKVGWNPDSFGYTWQLPQIYKKSGIDYFVTQKMSWNDTNKLPLKLFWWESPDGSKVLTYFPEGYANQVDAVQAVKQLEAARTVESGASEAMILYGVGDHGGGPTRLNLDEAARVEQFPAFPTAALETAGRFFGSVGKGLSPASPTWNYQTLATGNTGLPVPAAGLVSIPTWKDELYAEFHRGVFTTHADQKQSMRASEVWMLDAEKVSSLAWIGGLAYPQSRLDEAWKLVLFNQFHDLAAGSGVGAIYKDAQRDYDSVRATTDAIQKDSLAVLSAHVRTNLRAGEPVLVFNSLGWSRSEIVEVDVQFSERAVKAVSATDGVGKTVPAEVISRDLVSGLTRVRLQVSDIPPMGYKVLYLSPGGGSPAFKAKVSGFTLENEYLKVSVDSITGCLTELIEKKSNASLLSPGGCGDQLQFFHDDPKQYDAWEIDKDFDSNRIEVPAKADSVQVTEKRGLCAAITVKRKWGSSAFVQTIRLCDGSRRVDIENDIDWHETHVLLKVAFPLNISNSKATYEIPYGTIERPTTRNNSYEKAKFEVPALRWVDLGDGDAGVSLLNQSKYGYDVHNSLMRLTLLRSPVYPDPLADRGHHHFTFSLYPHAGTWKTALTMRRGYELNYPLYAVHIRRHDGTLQSSFSFAEVEPENLIMTSMKRAEDGSGLILRFFEYEGSPVKARIRAPNGASSANEVNLMEKLSGPLLPIESNNTIEVPVGAYEIKTLHVSYDKQPMLLWNSDH